MTGFALYRGPSLPLRRAYLASLEEPQEWFLEELVGSGSVWLHEDGSYAITHHDTLVEFSSASHDFGAKRLRNFHAQKGFSKALAKSFDTELVHSFRQLGWSETVGGHLFRRRKHVLRHAFEGADMHVAQPEDLEAIWRINDKFFSDEAEVADLTASKKLWMVQVSGTVAGCGVANPIPNDDLAVDIGMLVAKSFRCMGLGTYIVSQLADKVERDGQRPICGCGAINAASKATLEKAGFISEHQLLSFTPT